MGLVRKINKQGGKVQFGQNLDYSHFFNKCQWQCVKCNKIYGYRIQATFCARAHDDLMSKWIREDRAQVGKKLQSKITLNDAMKNQPNRVDLVNSHFGFNCKFIIMQVTFEKKIVEERASLNSYHDVTYVKCFVKIDEWFANVRTGELEK